MQIVFWREKNIVKVKRLSDCQQHCHFLKNSDWIKWNSVCYFLAISKVVKGYTVTAVLRNLSAVDHLKKQLLLKKTESHWLSLKNCHNAEAAYQKQNSDTCYNHAQLKLTEWVKCKNCVVSDMRWWVECQLDHESVELTLNRLSQFFENWPSFYIERIVSLMETIMFNSIQVINYWFILHCTLRFLYQQAQTFSSYIWGILYQNVTLWTLLQYKNDNQCAEVSFDKSSQSSRPSANNWCTQGTSTQCIHRQEREAASLLDQAWVVYWIQPGKVQVQDEQRSVYCIISQECSIWLSWPQTAWVLWQNIKEINEQ